ncbi:sialidase family protein [Dyadobacter sp. CY356]|uniref:sialidase family protein n=1 Tax=Dyadobacter sp. CY356 TaxID=2906442 RepID=UPI001F23805D|nr:sialidase family protein [Dyadobacter sp. CY356]MCF0058248.1 glycoside hydrolase [Dyadobacter sp. CY356]
MMLLKLLTGIFGFFAFLLSYNDTRPINTIGSEQVLGTGSQPEISVDAKGIMHIVYGAKNGNERDLYYIFSDDGGKSYSSPVLLGNFSQMGLGMGRGPQLTTTNDYTIVTVGDHHGNLYSMSLSNANKEWSKPVKVNDADSTAKEALSAICAGKNNLVYTAWLDTRLGNNNLYGSLSKDGGLTWGKNQLIYKGEQKGICECCKPSVAMGHDGVLYVMFRNKLNGARNMYLISSKDNGAHFDKARKLGSGDFMINGCPMDGGDLSADPSGRLITVWRRQLDIFMAEPSKPEIKLGSGRTPVTVQTSKGPVIAWHEGEIIQIKNTDSKNSFKLAKGQYPKLALANDKKSIFCVYELDGQIMLKSFRL